MNDKILAAAKKIKASDSGIPIWTAGLAPNAPDTIDGDPYAIVQQMPTGASAKALAYGQISKYKIHDASGLRLRRSTERYWELQQVGYMGVMRTDARLLDAGTHPVVYAANPGS